ncbi:MAG: hypothetical protein ABFS03_13865 [Chloroflexota bacterium]
MPSHLHNPRSGRLLPVYTCTRLAGASANRHKRLQQVDNADTRLHSPPASGM